MRCQDYLREWALSYQCIAPQISLKTKAAEWSFLLVRMKESFDEGIEGPNKCNCINHKMRLRGKGCQGWLNLESKLAGTPHREVSCLDEGRRKCFESQIVPAQLGHPYHSALTCQVLSETYTRWQPKIWCLSSDNMLNRTKPWYRNCVTSHRSMF